MSLFLLITLVGLGLPPGWTRPVRGRARAAARLVGHVAPVLFLPIGSFVMAWDASFLVGLLALLGYLAGAVRAAHLSVPRLTAERSLLHPILVGREALRALRQPGG